MSVVNSGDIGKWKTQTSFLSFKVQAFNFRQVGRKFTQQKMKKMEVFLYVFSRETCIHS